MKKLLVILPICLLLAIAPAAAHHPAADIVDAEIYAMIESMVSDMHLDLDFEDMDRGMEMTITTHEVQEIEVLIDDGLMTLVSMLSGRVSVEIEFKGSGRTIFTVTQIK